jgi:hypothetical protein
MPAHRMVRRTTRSARRRLTWANFTQSAVSVGASLHAVNIDLLGQYTAAGGDTNGATVMRTHLRVWPSTAVAAGDKIQLGVIVAGGQVAPSYAIGGGPYNPIDVPYVDWMLSDAWEARPTLSHVCSSNELMADLRSKRKITDLNETLILSAVAVVAGAALSVDVFARVLLALP